jgi:hypothetical protein
MLDFYIVASQLLLSLLLQPPAIALIRGTGLSSKALWIVSAPETYHADLFFCRDIYLFDGSF